MISDVPPSVSEVRARQQARQSKWADFWVLVGCNLVVFIASICIMVVELCASRLIAAYLGSSLYTWTSVIGVVLAGISIGNYLGGWIADRFPPHKALGWQFLVSGLATASVLILNRVAANNTGSRPEGMPWQFWVMALVGLVFLFPAISLGTISPVTASIAIRRSQRTGVTVGNIYAWGAMGSIVGTFLAGFWLIGDFGTKHIIWMTSAVLLVMGAIVSGGSRALRMFILFGALQFVLLVGIVASITAPQAADAVRSVVQAATGFSTRAELFEADDLALTRAQREGNEVKLASLQQINLRRLDQKASEDEWSTWGWTLGRKLHEVGLHCGLRRDEINEYNDESDYYAISIYNGRQDGDQVKVLRLDYLIHSYYNPQAPNRLHYDYERVYAAVTERSAETWKRTTSSPLEQPPTAPEFAGTLPERVKFDPETRRLSIDGAMTLEQAIQLLSIIPDGQLWKVVTSTWRQVSEHWKKATEFTGGALAVPFEPQPDILLELDQLPGAVSYDPMLRSLVFAAPFSIEEAFRTLAVGSARDYVEAVRDLYYRSRQTSSLFIGGGGFIFPRWIEAQFPWYPRIDVAEIDPAVLLAVQSQLGLPSQYGPPSEGKTFVTTHIGDARKFVDDRLRENQQLKSAGQPEVRYDFVYGDAFNDLSVPWHLTTREFSEKIRDLMTPGEGVYMVNIIDIYPRAKFPGRKGFEAVATVSGDLPPGLVADSVSATDWTSAAPEFSPLSVRRPGSSSFQLRTTEVLTASDRERLVQAAGGNAAFSTAISELMSELSRVSVQAPLPEGLFPEITSASSWYPALGEFSQLQIRERGATDFTLGFRGVMSDELRDRLLSKTRGNPGIVTAIEALAAQSRRSLLGRFLGRYLETAQNVFPYVYVFTSNDNTTEPGEQRDTFIVACSLKKLNFEHLIDSGEYWNNAPFAASERSSEAHSAVKTGQMAALLELARGLELTDDFAPVDNLLAPVFASRSREED